MCVCVQPLHKCASLSGGVTSLVSLSAKPGKMCQMSWKIRLTFLQMRVFHVTVTVDLHTCILPPIQHDSSVCSRLCFNSSWSIVVCFLFFSKAVCSWFYSNTVASCSRPLAENGWCWWVCFLSVFLTETAVLVAWGGGKKKERKDDDRGLALQIRSNYSSPPPFALPALLDLCCPS